MAILKETEIIYEVLGPIRFENGKANPKLRINDIESFWIARPMGWTTDGVEIYISGDSSGPAPDSLNRAVRAFNSIEKIEQEGRALIRPIIMNAPSPDHDFNHYEANLLWIDCQQTKTIAVFNWDGFTYVKWDATLNETYSIIDLQETTW